MDFDPSASASPLVAGSLRLIISLTGIIDPHLSPNGTALAFVVDRDLYRVEIPIGIYK
jgi:hypothetical protein